MKMLEQLQKHPEGPWALQIITELQAKGFKAFIAGGAVRDFLLQHMPNDLDIATSALPDQVIQIFPKCIEVGKSFGVIQVVDPISKISLEVATFRKDGESTDQRHPDQITFSDETEDALRRDFTVNALFYDPLADQLHDFVSGRIDLKHKIIKTVGEAKKRFQEDALRILRAVRLSAQLDFEIESETLSAIQANQIALKKISSERLREELTKGFKYPDKFAARLESSGLRTAIFGDHSQAVNPKQLALPKSFWAFDVFAFFTAPSPAIHFLDSLKFSNHEFRQIQSYVQGLQLLDQFEKLASTEKLLALQDESFAEGLEHQAELQANPQVKQEIVDLKKRLPLPQNLLNGHDFLNLGLTGKDIKTWMEKTYLEQIKQGWTEKKLALDWLQKEIK